jgi:small subunit ribosomal protein S6
MEKVLNSYESLFIVDLTNGEEAAKATVNKFTTLMAENGEIVDIADRGKRRLAYPINDMNEGYYTVVTFKAEASFPSELERLFNIDESIMRSIVLRLEYEAVAKPAAAEEVVAEEEAPAVEEAASADAE